jgi:hypothetical protein
MVTTLYAETLEQLQRTTRLNPESRNYASFAQVTDFVDGLQSNRNKFI